MKKVRVLAGLILCFAMIFAMVGCGEQKNPEKEENILCGIMNWQEPNDLDIFPTPALGEWKQYSSLTSMVLDLNAGNVEYLLVPASVASYLKAQDDSLTIAPGGAGVPTEIRMAVRAEDTELHQLLQDGIQTLREDGTLDDLIDTYITNVSTSGAAGGSQPMTAILCPSSLGCKSRHCLCNGIILTPTVTPVKHNFIRKQDEKSAVCA